jgi:hypothetical protein
MKKIGFRRIALPAKAQVSGSGNYSEIEYIS